MPPISEALRRATSNVRIDHSRPQGQGVHITLFMHWCCCHVTLFKPPPHCKNLNRIRVHPSCFPQITIAYKCSCSELLSTASAQKSCGRPAGELYTRPPNVIVGTAFQRCARGDWDESKHDWANHMSWLSVYNKLDYVRLHAASLHVFALWVRRSFPGSRLLCM